MHGNIITDFLFKRVIVVFSFSNNFFSKCPFTSSYTGHIICSHVLKIKLLDKQELKIFTYMKKYFYL